MTATTETPIQAAPEVTEAPPQMRQITEAEYQSLKRIEAEYFAMQAQGVDNWEGYEDVEWPPTDKVYA